jgi:hypothetical protein
MAAKFTKAIIGKTSQPNVKIPVFQPNPKQIFSPVNRFLAAGHCEARSAEAIRLSLPKRKPDSRPHPTHPQTHHPSTSCPAKPCIHGFLSTIRRLELTPMRPEKRSAFRHLS